MRVDEFDFDLPSERIALRPASPRDSARMLVVRPGQGLEDRVVSDLPQFLRRGDALVLNDTRVIPAQLEGIRVRAGDRRAAIGATLHRRVAPDRWRAFVRGAKKLKSGDRVEFGHGENACYLGKLEATVAAVGAEGEVEFAFDFAGPVLDDAIRDAGHVPLPPYIAARRADDERDRTDYQTIFAEHEGAVAAPTAGLHFTERLFENIRKAGASVHFVTLHVGAGTFLPVKAEDTHDHRMFAERGTVPGAVAEALNRTRGQGGRVVCIGTTSLRLLESAADAEGRIRAFDEETRIFITPGYRFRACDLLLTNFHLPRSTLFMLVSAFSGLATMREAYRHAIASGYRFYSYGDACLLYAAR
jgi:S-adenosylmethionine:tRNA ribosyltransferase-isomerase